MVSYLRSIVTAAALVSALGLAGSVSAQPTQLQPNDIDNNFKFNSGQDIQPIFEGWSKNPDGSFNFHFGYLNRNWVQHLSIPAGPNNSVDPAPVDRGQPTFFYPRMQRNTYIVQVPKDWGKKELVWSVTANGKTQKAFGWLQPEWEIDPAGGAATGGQMTPELLKNKKPSIAVTADATARVGQTVKLTGVYTDDGLPKPTVPKKPAVGQETPPTLVSDLDAPVNLPDLAPQRPGSGQGGGNAPRGPFVTWQVWRGPAAADFQSRNTPVKDGKVENAVSFSVPGEYVIRVRATDRHLFDDKDVKITVTGSTQQ